MSDLKQNRVYLDPGDIEEAMRQLNRVYDLDASTLHMLRRILTFYPRPVLLYVDEANASLYGQTPLIDKFTFNMQTDELVLFSRDPMTFIDAMIEMAMYVAGFATMIGVDDHWKVEFTIGVWKPIRSRVKRQLDIPVVDEPQWIVGLPPAKEDAPLEDPYPFRTLVSQLDIVSFTQMVRLAARDDVEVNFPGGSDPRVIQVYIRMKTAMNQVADGLHMEDWREFNHRLLQMVQDLEEEYQPHKLPVPVWWKRLEDGPDREEEPALVGDGQSGLVGDDLPDLLGEELPGERSAPDEESWNPFQTYVDELFDDDLPSPDDYAPDDPGYI